MSEIEELLTHWMSAGHTLTIRKLHAELSNDYCLTITNGSNIELATVWGTDIATMANEIQELMP